MHSNIQVSKWFWGVADLFLCKIQAKNGEMQPVETLGYIR